MDRMRVFTVGEYSFRLEYPETLVLPKNFLKFETPCAEAVHMYKIRQSDTLPAAGDEDGIRRPDLWIQPTPYGERRYIGIKGIEGFYACYEDAAEHYTEIWMDVEKVRDIFSDPIFMSLLAMERPMIARESLILHCAYMVYRGKAILFSAPSETGKSTQAGLWEKYRSSRTVNGDRALLRKIDGQWYADGWPVCGSSEICHAERYPIHAIVMLKQGKVNQTKRLSPMQAFAKVYSQITINQWNKAYVNKAIVLVEELAQRVPVYQLTCDISEEAVRCLEEALSFH